MIVCDNYSYHTYSLSHDTVSVNMPGLDRNRLMLRAPGESIYASPDHTSSVIHVFHRGRSFAFLNATCLKKHDRHWADVDSPPRYKHILWYVVITSRDNLVNCVISGVNGACCLAAITGATMMTSWNGNIFRVTGHLCGEFTGPRWIPHTKASDAELWCLLWSAPE